MISKRIAIVAVVNALGIVGGAEQFYEDLTQAFVEAGYRADLITVISDESNFDAIEESYLRFYDLDLNEYDGVISTKAPSYLVRHPNHICYLVHTMRVFYDMFEQEFLEPSNQLIRHRDFIHELDNGGLSYPRTKKIFAIGHEVRKRLNKYNGLDCEVLHPPLASGNFHAGEFNNYILMPGRLHRWKRVDLAIKAIQQISAPLCLKIVGTGEDEAHLKKIAGDNSRIKFLGNVSDQELAELYANSFAVSFLPIREDYGYITLEAFKSRKPVITCSDSGEPTHFVQNGKTGFVCKPDPGDIAGKVEYLFHNPKLAKEMGGRGFQSVKHIAWGNIVDRLIKELKL